MQSQRLANQNEILPKSFKQFTSMMRLLAVKNDGRSHIKKQHLTQAKSGAARQSPPREQNVPGVDFTLKRGYTEPETRLIYTASSASLVKRNPAMATMRPTAVNTKPMARARVIVTADAWKAASLTCKTVIVADTWICSSQRTVQVRKAWAAA